MKPILLEFPSELTTERLYIRMPRFNDGKQIFESLLNSQGELKAWLPFANTVLTEENVEIECRQAHIRFLQRKELRMYLFDKETGAFVGSSGYHNINWDIPSLELGYWLDSRYTGKGYMTEAIQALTDFAFEQLNVKRIVIKCDPKNVKSKEIPVRLGYNLEGILINEDLSADGSKLTDTMIYAKTKMS